MNSIGSQHIFALALHFSVNFNTIVDASSHLFPGNDQHARFGKLLNKVLLEHQDKVQASGYCCKDIGTHSVRKGAVSYLASLVSGPPAAATCICAGLTMGRVQDVYISYVASGNQFVGRSLSLLPILLVKFGAFPYFTVAWEEWSTQEVLKLWHLNYPCSMQYLTFTVLHLCAQLLLFITENLLPVHYTQICYPCLLHISKCCSSQTRRGIPKHCGGIISLKQHDPCV